MTTSNKQERLESLDILRGLDLFVLVCFQPIFMHLAQALGKDSWVGKVFQSLFTHVEWEGFHLWDQVMPLFLFMTGTSIPYALSKYKRGEGRTGQLVRRVSKRVILLWVFGAIVQGNLLDLNMDTLYLYTDTLQAIAMGYLFSAILYLLLPIRFLFVAFLLLPIIYTIGMLLTGGYLPGENIAEQIDRTILGRFLYGASGSETGQVVFADWYHISWIYSTLNFTATVLSGTLIGCLLKSDISAKQKLRIMGIAGGASLLIAGGLSFVEPVIKRLWTSSMMFLSSGISILLMLIFYYWIDICKRGKYLKWLRIYGMNSILAYMLYNTLDTSSLRTYWLHGFNSYLGGYYSVLLEFSHVSIVFLILYYCYRHKIYFKV